MAAEGEPKDEIKRRAIIVGTNYVDCPGGIPKLEGAQNDAEEIYERLSDPNFGNFEIPKSRYLRGNQATSENIRTAISEVFYDTDITCDLALFYFSGHGFNDKWYSDLYLAPYDMDKKQPFVKGIKKSELNQVIAKSVPNQVKCALVILDCCYSGLETNNPERAVNDKTFESHITEFSSESQGLLAIGSSGGEQPAKELDYVHKDGNKHKHGAFSSWFIDGLDTLQGSAGKIHFSELWDHVCKKASAAKELGINQTPTVNFKDVSGFGSIEIAVSRMNWDQLIPKLEDAAAAENSGEPSLYIDGTLAVYEVLAVNSKFPRALEVKDIVVKGLQECEKAVQSWYVENRQKIKAWTIEQRISSIIPELDCFASEFPPLEKIAKSSPTDKIYLTNFCEVAMGKMRFELFKIFLKQRGASLLPVEGVQKKDSMEGVKSPAKADGFIGG